MLCLDERIVSPNCVWLFIEINVFEFFFTLFFVSDKGRVDSFAATVVIKFFSPLGLVFLPQLNLFKVGIIPPGGRLPAQLSFIA